MKARMKRLLIGFGIMFGMQFLAAYFGLKVGGSGNNPESTFYIMLGFTLAAYFGGGLIMGLLADHVIVLEPALAALLSVAVNATLAGMSGSVKTGELRIADVLFTSYAIQKGAVVSLLIAVGAALVAALVGALVGERIAIPTYDWISTGATWLGLICLVIGPIVLLSRVGTERGLPGIPLPFLIIIGLLFLVVVGIGYVLFTRESHEAEEISISPDHRRDLS